MGRVTIEKCCAPRFEPREFFDVPEPLDAIEKYIALQKRRVGGIDQRVLGTIEKRTAVLFFQGLLEALERHRDPFGSFVVFFFGIGIGGCSHVLAKVGT